MNFLKKSWISPFMAVMYGIVSLTGLFMLFHLKLSGVHAVHQWAGVLFVAGGGLHLFLNRGMLKSHFKKPGAAWALVVGLLAIAMLTIAMPQNDHGDRYQNGIRNNSGHGQRLR